MAWEPITVSEEMVRDFAVRAVALCDELDDRGKLMWRTIIDRAGGDGEPARSASEPAAGRHRANGGDGAAGKREPALDHFTRMLLSVWEPGTTIAPLYSGNMPDEGGGTVD